MNWLERKNAKTVMAADALTITEAGKDVLTKYGEQLQQALSTQA